MELSPTCEAAYKAWIRAETWHTGHDCDKKHFYRFVSVYAQYSRKKISPHDLKMDIIERYSGKLEPEFLEQKAHEYAYLFSELYEYRVFTRYGGPWPPIS